jgi:hypothetical protein
VSVFERESRVTEATQRPGWSALECALPQFRWIEESYFEGPNVKWPDDAFDIFIKDSLVSGYILGLIQGSLLPDPRLSEAEIVDVVILASVHFEVNGFPAGIADSYVHAWSCKETCSDWLSAHAEGDPQPFCPNAALFQAIKS